jgi:uncharacterized membrane protein
MNPYTSLFVVAIIAVFCFIAFTKTGCRLWGICWEPELSDYALLFLMVFLCMCVLALLLMLPFLK